MSTMSDWVFGVVRRGENRVALQTRAFRGQPESPLVCVSSLAEISPFLRLQHYTNGVVCCKKNTPLFSSVLFELPSLPSFLVFFNKMASI